MQPVRLGYVLDVGLNAVALRELSVPGLQLFLLGALAACRQVQREQSAGGHRDRRRDLHRVQLRCRLLLDIGQGQAVDPPPQPPTRPSREYEHD
uniref:hypothetical protein n=1 Tax=Saccharothrix espanaensis TaxID=103731 RepID=UPI003F490EDA